MFSSTNTKLRDRTKSFRIFFKLCSQKCRTPLALTNRLRQTPPPNSNGNMLFEAFFDFRPHGTIYGPKSKNASKSMFPFEFCGGVWRNRLVRAGGVRQFWAHNLKKISKTFFTIPYIERSEELMWSIISKMK